MTTTDSTRTSVQLAQDVRAGSRVLAGMSGDQRAALVVAIADEIDAGRSAILAANATDMDAGRRDDIGDALLDRLALDDERIDDIVAGARAVAALEDPVGEVLEDRTLASGVHLRKVRVPFGVLGVIYEARPNVTIDAAAIALRSGNGIILRGSRRAAHTNAELVHAVSRALNAQGAPVDCVGNVDPHDRSAFIELIADPGLMDMVIPRGGEGLKRFLYEHSRVPILAAAGGVCHAYVGADADAEMAVSIILNAKTQRPGVCNAVECVLIDSRAEQRGIGKLVRDALDAAGVTVHEDPDTYGNEYLDLEVDMRVVDGVDEAISHINSFGTGHSEVIITGDEGHAERFLAGVDAACVYVNASTRFTDGAMFGLGAEVGISTSRLHARGPIGLRELTTTRYLLRGDGQVRT